MNYSKLGSRIGNLINTLGERLDDLIERKAQVKAELAPLVKAYNALFNQSRAIEASISIEDEDINMWNEMLIDIENEMIKLDNAIGDLESERDDIGEKIIDIDCTFENAENELEIGVSMSKHS